jgi:hypothetical protein
MLWIGTRASRHEHLVAAVDEANAASAKRYREVKKTRWRNRASLSSNGAR